jgi:hypothetical protein
MTFSTQAPRGIRFDPSSFSKRKWANLQDAEIHIDQAAYSYPERETDLRTAVVEVPVLEHAVRFRGTQENPVQNISPQGFRIAHTATPYLKPYDVPSLSDWAIHRGGSVFKLLDRGLRRGRRQCCVR